VDSYSPLKTWARSCTVRPTPIQSDMCSHCAVPVNLKDRDEFHLSLEEYLQSLISLVEELVRFKLVP
jgi:hypothetical protein